jgi:hypothetical protein
MGGPGRMIASVPAGAAGAIQRTHHVAGLGERGRITTADPHVEALGRPAIGQQGSDVIGRERNLGSVGSPTRFMNGRRGRRSRHRG